MSPDVLPPCDVRFSHATQGEWPFGNLEADPLRILCKILIALITKTGQFIADFQPNITDLSDFSEAWPVLADISWFWPILTKETHDFFDKIKAGEFTLR